MDSKNEDPCLLANTLRTFARRGGEDEQHLAYALGALEGFLVSRHPLVREEAIAYFAVRAQVLLAGGDGKSPPISPARGTSSPAVTGV